MPLNPKPMPINDLEDITSSTLAVALEELPGSPQQVAEISRVLAKWAKTDETVCMVLHVLAYHARFEQPGSSQLNILSEAFSDISTQLLKRNSSGTAEAVLHIAGTFDDELCIELTRDGATLNRRGSQCPEVR